MFQAGESSKTDIVLCYMDSRVDHGFLEELKTKINHIQADALTMNQESLAECLFDRKWFNPFPKFKRRNCQIKGMFTISFTAIKRKLSGIHSGRCISNRNNGVTK